MSASESEHALSMCCAHLVNMLLMFTPLQAPQSCVSIKNSPMIVIPKWFLMLDKLGLGHRMMPRDVSMQWSSTYDMLLFALKYRRTLNVITEDREMKLCQYEMDDEEWGIARELCDVLEVFKDATLFFSRDGTPTSQQLFLRWIASMKPLPPVHLTLNTPFQYKLRSPWARGL